MSENLRRIKTFTDEPSALLARAILEANGIPSLVDASGALPYGTGLQFARGIRLSVRGEDAAAALELLGPD